MEEVEDSFLSFVEVAKAAANKRKMDDVAAIGEIEGSYTAVVRGSKSLPWQQQTTLDTASKLTITMPSDAAYDDSFSKSLRNRIARFLTHLMKRIQSSYQFFIGRKTMKHFFQIVCGPLYSSNLISIRSQGYPIFYLGGEWECPQWNFFNYGRNVVCLRCDCKRPGETPLGASGPVFGLTMVKL
ncbi:hypothetical protein MRB53_001957 [Persea americana]|uniref:Uncharacterized protein n=1 Tax=Persea americana TaxID=3435 RepID=A0ACC2MTD5_PERAE|nr:hypothetical protein MRB53_001957 [Persea americana]